MLEMALERNYTERPILITRANGFRRSLVSVDYRGTIELIPSGIFFGS